MSEELAGHRILLADDDEELRHWLKKVFEAAGARVAAVADGSEAGREAARGVFDLFVLDVDMPVMDGFEACRRIRATPHSATAPVLVLTANSDGDTVEKAFQAGASDFLAKPASARLILTRAVLLIKLSALSAEVSRLKTALGS